MSDILVFHSFRSPYSRLGLHVLNRASIAVDLILFTGPPRDVKFSDPVENSAKLAYFREDVGRMTMRMGLPIMPPEPFDVDFAPSYAAAIAASRDGFGMAFALAVYDARWGEGKNIADNDVIRACASSVDWSPDAAIKAQNDMFVAKAIRKQRALIEEHQVFGVPFAVANGAKYWGHDRFALLADILKGAG